MYFCVLTFLFHHLLALFPVNDSWNSLQNLDGYWERGRLHLFTSFEFSYLRTHCLRGVVVGHRDRSTLHRMIGFSPVYWSSYCIRHCVVGHRDRSTLHCMIGFSPVYWFFLLHQTLCSRTQRQKYTAPHDWFQSSLLVFLLPQRCCSRTQRQKYTAPHDWFQSSLLVLLTASEVS